MELDKCYDEKTKTLVLPYRFNKCNLLFNNVISLYLYF